ncbi:MAG: copper homeostasis protein CutC [Flavobacterium sp.]|nr:copper homeostasis protein CutC [Flavobacterium sp.]
MARLEIACFSVESALIAQQAGAHRIELCADRLAGGITPEFSVFEQVKAQVELPIYVMIRPRGGNFVYTFAEFELMKHQMLQFKEAGAHGFVFGCLTENGAIHPAQNKELVHLAHPLPCTFHRAFDEVENKELGLQALIEFGFKSLLTAGDVGNAVNGIAALQKLQAQAQGKITLLAGGGIRANRVRKLLTETGLHWVHSSAITNGKEADVAEIKALLSVCQMA